MEEILTIDGKQFKLTTDIPLTAEQKAQTIAEIRKQTGCGTCGQPRVARMGNDWQYGGVSSLVNTYSIGSSCLAGTVSAGSVITLNATPKQGVAPYTIDFRRSNSGDTTLTMTDTNYAGTTYSIPTGRIAGNPFSGQAEGATLSKSYTIDTTDVNDATYRAGGSPGASLLFGAAITDSCSPAQTCVSYCQIFVACPAPVCDFTVT